MTADLVKGKGFRGALSYNLQKVAQGKAEVLDSTFAEVNAHSIMQEVRMVRMLRPNLSKYFYHTSLNFPPEENLSNQEMNKLASEYLFRMGFDQHQYILFRHYDADHPHVHLLVNRIGYDGTVVSDSKDYKRTEDILRKLEKQYGLIQVPSSSQAQERAMTKDELEMMKRTDEPSVKLKLQVILKDVLSSKPTTEQFINQLQAKGINVLFNQATTGFVSGISYGYEGMRFKGAHLGNAYKWSSIKQTISYEQERDRQAICQANLAARAASAANNGQSAAAAGTTINTKPSNGTGRADGSEAAAGRDQGTAPGSAGKLQGQLRNAGRRGSAADEGTQGADRRHAPASEGNSAESQGPQPKQRTAAKAMGHPAVPECGLISHLLSPAYDAGDVDHLQALEQNRRRKRRKKRGHSQ